MRRLTLTARSALQQAPELIGYPLVIRKNGVDRRIAEVRHHRFTQNIPEIGGQSEIPLFVKLLLRESRPLAVNFSAFHWSAHHKHGIRVSMVRAPVAVFPRCTPEFRH